MRLLYRAIHAAWKTAATPSARRFHRAVRNVESVQREILEQTLRRNAATNFGHEHGFGRLATYEAFRDTVPPQSYEDLAPWIDAAAAGAEHILTRDPIEAFLPTSGTSSGRKLIPWTRSLHREFQHAINPWVQGFMQSDPAAWRGPAYWSISPPVWTPDRTAGGIPIGFASDTSYLASSLRPLFAATLAVPAEVASIRDTAAWQYATLAFLLRSRELSLISVWSPTFLSALLEPLAAWWPSLLDDIQHGTLHAPDVGRCPRRAHELRAIANPGSPESIRRIWPRLATISCWTDAGARRPAQALARRFPDVRIVGKGLVATEGIVSFPVPGAAAPALAVTSHFYEFTDSRGLHHPAWSLRLDEEYSVLLTTGGGLYRYRLGDRVRVVGFLEACPLLEFLGREDPTCDLCGEKMTEAFVRACLDQACRELTCAWTFAMLVPSSSATLGYVLLFAPERDDTSCNTARIAQSVEARLCRNVHYAHARRVGQLAPLTAQRIGGDAAWATARYQERLLSEGRSPGSIKPATVDARPGWEARLCTPAGMAEASIP